MFIKNSIKLLISWLKYQKRIKSYKTNDIKKIGILYFIPKSNIEKYNNWEDGFTKAINLLEQEYNITWINLEDTRPSSEDLNALDFIIVKSCWDWKVDKYFRSLKAMKTPCAIAISCSKLPKSMSSMFHYDVLFYETEWYGKQLKYHPRKFQAFGINSENFSNQSVDKDIDVLSIGLLAKYKRHNKIVNQIGDNKVVIGDTTGNESAEIRAYLESNNIKVFDFSNQRRLSEIINRSRVVYIPAEINGGGERAVLEARACGVFVKVENDNPKLKELLNSKIYNEKDYHKSLMKGIRSIIEKSNKPNQ